MVRKELGKKQSIARELNTELVLKLIKEKPYSATEVASILKLSNATSCSILNSFLQLNLIKIHSMDSINGHGRKRVTYSLNDKYCLILVISITNFSINITISNLVNETLVSETREISRYDIKILYETIIKVKDILAKKELRDIPLKNIIVSLPGLINKNTGELQGSPQFDKDFYSNGHNIIDLLKDSFNCDVYLENDSKLMMLGELSQKTFPINANGMLIYCDIGIGGALEFNNKMYLGSRGYAGEIGLIKVANEEGKEDYLDEFISLRALKNIIKDKYNLDCTIEEMFNLYNQGNKNIIKEVENNAKIFSKAIIDVVNVFDLDYFVIGGRIINFGDYYLNKLKEYVNEKVQNITIKFSNRDGDAIIDGAKSIAVNHILNLVLEDIKNNEKNN